MFFVFPMEEIQTALKVPTDLVTFPQDKPEIWGVLWVFVLIFLAILAILLLFNLTGGASKPKHSNKILFCIVCSLIIVSIAGVAAAATFKANRLDKQRDNLLKLDRELENNQQTERDPSIKEQLERLEEVNIQANKFSGELLLLTMQEPVAHNIIEKEIKTLEPVTEKINKNRELAQQLNLILTTKKEQFSKINKQQAMHKQNIDSIETNDSLLTEKNKILQEYLSKNMEEHLTFSPIVHRGDVIYFGAFSYNFKNKQLGLASLNVPRPSLNQLEEQGCNIYNSLIVRDTWYFDNENLIDALVSNKENGGFRYEKEQFRFMFLKTFQLLYLKPQKTTIIKTSKEIIVLSAEGVVLINPEEKNLQIYRFLNPEVVFEYDATGQHRSFESTMKNNGILRSFSQDDFTYRDFRPQLNLKNKEYDGNILLETQGEVLVLDQEVSKESAS